MTAVGLRIVGRFVGLGLVALLTSAVLPAGAHVTSTGLARIEVEERTVHYRLTLAVAEIGDAGALLRDAVAGDSAAAQRAVAAVQQHLTVAVDDRLCAVGRARLRAPEGDTDHVTLLLDWQCDSVPGPLRVRDTLPEVFGAHYRTIVSIGGAAAAADERSGDRRQEHVLDREHAELRVDLDRPAPSAVTDFLRLGLDHILGGVDHLLFLAALLLGSRGLRSLLLTVTAFTAAHSLSLAVATLGWAHVSPAWVEPAIAASIIWVAAENVWLSPTPLRRHALTFVFGLVHGLAFAEALTDLHLGGWPLARALFGFNAGVEMGQALVVLLLAPALTWIERRTAGPRLERAMSASIAAIGLFWLVQRMLPA